MEPVEKITFEIEDRFTALILDKMNQRKSTYMSSDNKGDKVKIAQATIEESKHLMH